MMTRNPKQEGTNLFDCKPQTGVCPIGCNQCFHNRPGAFYITLAEPHFPTLEEVGDGIVRVNSGHDSNIDREQVFASTAHYKQRFFNTSLPNFDFPGPVVFTANREEEKPPTLPSECGVPDNLMFVRLRVSGTNLHLIDWAAMHWTNRGVPVVLTLMAYYDRKPEVEPDTGLNVDKCYEWRTRHINSYWCPTKMFMQYILGRYTHERLVSLCGSYAGPYCRNCRNCETYYWQAAKRMRGE